MKTVFFIFLLAFSVTQQAPQHECGVVKFFNEEKNYGRIQYDTYKYAFVSGNDCKDEIKKGDLVCFTLTQSVMGDRAKDVFLCNYRP